MNYRSISLTCVSCKVFESVVKKQMLDYLLHHSLLHSAQHGFIAGHSTCTNLLESLNDWTINLRNGACTRVAFIDFSRAFDAVCHSKLLLKLKSYGFSGGVIKIIESFLSDRTQCVVIEGALSNHNNVVSGVPQGSVLGPLLFLIFINDLAEIFPNKVISKYFADDAKLYTDITTGDDIDDLQFSLDLLSDWARLWQLNISFGKCSTIDLAKGSKVGAYCENSLDGHLLVNNIDVTDLGVKLDNGLTFTPHICQVVAKAKQRVFMLFRAFRSPKTDVLLLGYNSYILPILDYCSSVWSPGLLGNIEALESVQRLFTRRLPGMKQIPYPNRLKILKLPSLELRRLRADLLLCFKILNEITAGPPSNYGLVVVKTITRGHDMKLYHDHDRIDARRNYFSSRVCAPWNSLPAEVVHSDSAMAFKRMLRGCNL